MRFASTKKGQDCAGDRARKTVATRIVRVYSIKIQVSLVGVLCVCFAGTPALPAPGALNQVVLNLNPRQIVGQPLIGPANVLLLDDTGVLLTDYDLAANPITLSGSVGAFSPAVISDPALFANGVVNLLPAQVRFLGETGNVVVQAETSSIPTSPVLVSFSGYDVTQAMGLSPDTTARIYANMATLASVEVTNRGDQVALSEPVLRVSFLSSGSSTETSFPPLANAQITSVAVALPTTGLAEGTDTLCLALQSAYFSGGQTVTVTDTLLIPVQVFASQGLRFVTSSVEPDSVYAGIPFDLSFRLASGGVTLPWDSASYRFEVVTATDSLLAVAFDGEVIHSSFTGDTLTYTGIAALIPELVLPGAYQSQAVYSLFMGGLVLQPVAPFSGNFVVLPRPSLSYVPGTLGPTEVNSGQEWSFYFDLMVGGTRPLTISPAESFFQLSLASVSIDAPFPASGTTLNPGVNHITTRRLFVPIELLGLSLNAAASATCYHSGAANHLTFESDFNGETIGVKALPLIQVIETVAEAPNAPLVNTGQPFQIKCKVANLSPTTMTPFNLRLVTDGFSEFDSIVSVAGIPGGDTLEVTFDVVAADAPNPAEIFRVDIATLGVNRLPPIDNIALITVQSPAELTVSIIVRGADQGYVNVGNGFDLLIGLVNTGEAQATSGRFRINTNGVDLGLPGGATVVEEVISVGSVRGLSFVAPPFDTALQIDVDLIQVPLDVNTNLPAIVGDTTFQIALAVTSLDVRLHVEAAEVLSNIVLSDGPRELLVLRMFNPGKSTVSDIRLNAFDLSFFGADHLPLKVRSVIEVGSTGLYADGMRVTNAASGENHLTLLFPDYIVSAGDTVELVLRTRILDRGSNEFSINMLAADIAAEFASGPLEGQSVSAVTSDGAGVILDEVFTLVRHSLSGSFAVRTNPWDPGHEPAEFMYYLPRDEAATFAVLTLTGEDVYRVEYRAGETGARMGENTVFWDGRSDDGTPVLNGVYVVVVSIDSGRQQATLKLAVMK